MEVIEGGCVRVVCVDDNQRVVVERFCGESFLHGDDIRVLNARPELDRGECRLMHQSIILNAA